MSDSLITEELLKLKVPTILAIHSSSNPKDLPVIKTDSFSIAKMASEHIREKGLKNFTFCGFDSYDWSKEHGLFFSHLNNEAVYQTHIYVLPKKLKKIIGIKNNSM